VTPPSLAGVVAALHAEYGDPSPPPTSKLFELVVWENVVYLADDRRREQAFAALRAEPGLEPEALLSASAAELTQATGHGILPAHQAEKLHRAAALVVDRFDGDLDAVVRGWPLERARRALRQFPSLGAPGADRVLLLGHAQPVFALESNGLRVLVRLGFVDEQPSYAATYRAVMAAIEDQLPSTIDELISAHLLLRRHGQTRCRRTQPDCAACPLRGDCLFASSFGLTDDRHSVA
jgi:endonuclease III